jgi:hypothetical protein
VPESSLTPIQPQATDDFGYEVKASWMNERLGEAYQRTRKPKE